MSTNPLNRRQFITRSAMTVGALAGASALLDACSSASKGTTTITTTFGENELSKADKALFEKMNPGYKVVVVDQSAAAIAAMFAAGRPPDLLRSSGAPSVPNYAGRGLLENLDPYIAKSKLIKVDDLQPVNDVYRWDGKAQGKGPRYGMVKDWSQDAMIWYNKKIFDAAHIAYPSATVPMTYAEYLDLGKRLTVRQGDKIQVYGLDPAYVFGFDYPQIIQSLLQEGASLFSADFTKVDFTTPEVKAVLQWYVDWAQAHIGPSPLDAGDTAFTLFPADRLAMVQFGYWFGGAIIGADKNGLQDHVGFAPAPVWGKQRVSSCFYGVGATIPAASKNKEGAWKLFEFFMGGAAAASRAALGAGLPAQKSNVAKLPTTQPYQQQALSVQNAEFPFFQVLSYPPYATDAAIGGAVNQYLEQVMRGQSTMDQATKQMTDTVNLLLQQGQQQIG